MLADSIPNACSGACHVIVSAYVSQHVEIWSPDQLDSIKSDSFKVSRKMYSKVQSQPRYTKVDHFFTSQALNNSMQLQMI